MPRRTFTEWFMDSPHRWWQHLVFWSAVLLILLNIFKSSSSIERIDVIYTLIFLVPLSGVTYLNLYHFIPRYLRREYYLLYSVFLIMLTVGGALFLFFLFDRWIDLLLPNYYFISYYNVWHLMIYTGSLLLITTLLKLSRSWFLLLRVERLTANTQLRSLQSQINPHFLLNSLQTIYALSLEKSEKTPDVILRLSDILKYTLYETDQPRIPLKQEFKLVQDYVEMYRYRVDPVRADIQLSSSGDPSSLKIAPMLLIPFIENGFKHGLSSGHAEAYVHIHLSLADQKLQCEVRNNKGQKDPVEVDGRKGIGIENTRKRLEILYPGNHDLKIQEDKDSFQVILNINLKNGL
jgi:sensor histidine kinase YesM